MGVEPDVPTRATVEPFQIVGKRWPTQEMSG